MSGALSERVFVKKLENVGFVDIEVVERSPFGVSEAAPYPLFTPEVLQLMDELLPPARKEQVATAITVRARKVE